MHLDALVYNSFQIILEIPNIETFPVDTSHVCSFDEKTRIRKAHPPEAQDAPLPQHDQPTDASAVGSQFSTICTVYSIIMI